MKVAVIQPYYSFSASDTEQCYRDMMAMLDSCDESFDIIALPEYSDIPAVQGSKAAFHASIDKYNSDVISRAKAAAKRCSAIVFVNAADITESGKRNTTYAINRNGDIVGKYYKAHPAPSESKTEREGGNELDVSYCYEHREPYVIEIEGLRFGFMTCYDFYFYEGFAPLAMRDVDIIIGCSHQRTDTHEALSIINRFLCYNTNAYLIRASVSLGEDSTICGCSSVIAPNGDVLVDMKSKIGIGSCDIDPKKKYFKPAGFGGSLKAHYEYIEEGRRPWLYRNGGASVVPYDSLMPYPRLCAHRGLSGAIPENTLPALGAAVALGASEIEFDVWSTKDGELVVAHDETLERVSNGHGKISDYTYSELLELDFGKREEYSGLKIPRFEEVMMRLASHTVMNIHVKIWDCEREDDKLELLVSTVRKYDCARHVYFMTTSDEKMKKLKAFAPDIKFCVGFDGNPDPMNMVRRALLLGADKIQLLKPYISEEAIKAAKAHGIICNIFYADDVEEARRYLEMGADTILTNEYLRLSSALGIK